MISEYRQVHKSLKQIIGFASDFMCVCGSRALDWAYQHTGETLYDDRGRPYSLDLRRYAPMCRPCHKILDCASTGNRDQLAGARSARDKEVLREQCRINGRKRWRCGSCGMVSSKPAIGRHQKFSNHTGYEET